MTTLTELPRIDVHSVDIDAPARDAWRSLIRVLPRSFAGRGNTLFARVVGCEDVGDGHGPLAVGSTFNGFHVTQLEAPHLLAVEGRHRFSRYALIMRVEELGRNRTRLSAETRAVFPGLAGRAYRAAVIGSRGHVLAVRRILRAVARSATRATIEPAPPERSR